jgi:SAM-dependent methyltransferase
MPRPTPVLLQHALAAYAEPLAVRRRVAVISEDDTLPDRLLDLGAREARLLRASEELERLPTGSFDLALVTDLGAHAEPARLLSQVRRIVGDAGAALVLAANRDVATEPGARAFDYYALFDLVAGEFADVKMVAQVPFHGVVLAELGLDDESPAVSVDTQLAPEPQAPHAYVALASQRGVSLEAYAIFELPPPPPPEIPEPPRLDLEAIAAVQVELARERLRAEALASQVDTLRPQVARAVELEREVMSRGRALAELSSEFEEVRAAAEAGAAAVVQIEELARRADRAERALLRFEPELARLNDAHAAELQRFEAALRERAAAVRVLEAEIVRRDRMVQELVSALEEHVTAAPGPAHTPVHAPAHAVVEREPSDEALEENTRLRERLDAMAMDLARREGEAQASAWKIEELERRLAAAATPRSTPISGVADRSAELSAALDQIDALRRALTQEHEQRIRAEAALARPSGVGIEPPAP